MSDQEIMDLFVRRKPWAAKLINELFADWPPYDPEELWKVELTRPDRNHIAFPYVNQTIPVDVAKRLLAEPRKLQSMGWDVAELRTAIEIAERITGLGCVIHKLSTQDTQDSVGESTHTSSVPENMVSKHGQ